MRQEEVKALLQRYIGDRTAAAVDRMVRRAVILELPSQLPRSSGEGEKPGLIRRRHR
jgi:hypothetical protein